MITEMEVAANGHLLCGVLQWPTATSCSMHDGGGGHGHFLPDARCGAPRPGPELSRENIEPFFPLLMHSSRHVHLSGLHSSRHVCARLDSTSLRLSPCALVSTCLLVDSLFASRVNVCLGPWCGCSTSQPFTSRAVAWGMASRASRGEFRFPYLSPRSLPYPFLSVDLSRLAGLDED